MPATLTCHNCGQELTGGYNNTVETPFPDLLQLVNNRVFPAALSEIAHAAVSAADQDILRLEAELRRKRSERRAFVIAHKAFISPIRRTPPEIITEIFLHYVEGNLRSPVPLASICKRLRFIALSSPQLWASFRMSINHNNVESQTALAEMCLSRAGKYPLNINLESHYELSVNQIPAYEFTTMKPLMDAFVARCEQWRTIELTLPPDLIKYLSEGATNGLDRLEKLTLGHNVYEEETIPMCFLAMPRLRSLEIAWLYDPTPQLPWQQLQELSFTAITTAQACLDVLIAASTLQKCQLGLLLTQMENIQALPSIALPLLRCMSITLYNRVNLSHFLSAISLPAIEELSIAEANHHTSEGHPPEFIGIADAIVSMISHGSLLKLTLDLPSPTWYATPANTISILRAVPKLLEITLIGTTAQVLSREFVDQFNPQDGCLVPGLQTLNMAASWQPLDLSIAVDMIEGRCLSNHQSSLKQVVLRGQYMKYALNGRPALQSRLLLVKRHSGIDVQLLSLSLEDMEI
ncbi:hypothetical protein FIBSPDRAFT_1054816 [Athelia psychrophila]|uniref:F-box domain-containing protein n=1 Tax=Athelia psychrophila TaxID=1759441 RepID=A0A167US55_9AGAM|nr:hypothetical protein FIBSPDRAFT_1054816 [Fibularhizoctonia sp. CBS 109695]